MNRRKERASGIEHPLWLITFADLSLLLLVFFILQYSIQEPPAALGPPPSAQLDERVVPAPADADMAELLLAFPEAVLMRGVDDLALNEVRIPEALAAGELSFRASALLRALARSAAGTKQKLELTVDLRSSADAPWQEAQSLALSLARQIIDAGVDSQCLSAFARPVWALRGSESTGDLTVRVSDERCPESAELQNHS